jgi:hypothetical protein
MVLVRSNDYAPHEQALYAQGRDILAMLRRLLLLLLSLSRYQPYVIRCTRNAPVQSPRRKEFRSMRCLDSETRNVLMQGL